MKGLAAVLVEQKAPLVLEEIDIPDPGFGQVLVKLMVSGICGSQLGEIDGVKGPDPFLPHLLGHEGCAAVLACGEGVRTVTPGDHVVLHWRKGIGIESPCPRYSSRKFGEINAGWVTTFNEYALVSENRLTPIPKDFDPECAALFGCAVTTGFGVINNNARVNIGESVVVWGAGGIGLSIVQGAALASAWPIIAIDRFDTRLQLARELGASHVINAEKTAPAEAIADILEGRGADVVIENTGAPEIIGMAYEATGPSGRTVLVGVPPKGAAARIYTLPLHFEKILTGSHGGESHPEVDIPNYIRLHRAGRLHLERLVTDRFSLEEINTAIDAVRKGRVAGRCLIDFQA